MIHCGTERAVEQQCPLQHLDDLKKDHKTAPRAPMAGTPELLTALRKPHERQRAPRKMDPSMAHPKSHLKVRLYLLH